MRRLPKNLGTLLLALWLILVGLSGFVDIGDLGQILDLLAVAAGVALLLAS
jgi:hypothetical protein